MNTPLKFSVTINASKEKVWDILWNDQTYPQWTAVFAEGSTAESDWQQGSKIIFGDGKGSGMYSVIETLDLYNTMVFKHIGEVVNGVETEKDWSGANESYRLTEIDNYTLLNVELDMSEEYKEYFEDTFPKALALVKEMAENK